MKEVKVTTTLPGGSGGSGGGMRVTYEAERVQDAGCVRFHTAQVTDPYNKVCACVAAAVWLPFDHHVALALPTSLQRTIAAAIASPLVLPNSCFTRSNCKRWRGMGMRRGSKRMWMAARVRRAVQMMRMRGRMFRKQDLSQTKLMTTPAG
jgi:hypothetical protein